jgi:hypothetical protein
MRSSGLPDFFAKPNASETFIQTAIKKQNEHSTTEKEKRGHHEPSVKWPDNKKGEIRKYIKILPILPPPYSNVAWSPTSDRKENSRSERFMPERYKTEEVSSEGYHLLGYDAV